MVPIRKKTRDTAWALLTELARDWANQDHLSISLVISTFELFAEPPEVAETLELLFSLAANPETRWAIFASYENYPWRLSHHAEKYSNGEITQEECENWLTQQQI